MDQDLSHLSVYQRMVVSLTIPELITCGRNGSLVWGTVQYYSSSDTAFNMVNFSDTAPGADAGICGSYRLTLPSGGYSNFVGSVFTGRAGDGGPPNPALQSMIAFKYKSTTNLNAFKFYFSSSNITGGTIRVYGVGH